MLRRIWVLGILCLAVIMMPKSALATYDVQAHLFYGEGCPHCAKEKVFLGKLIESHPELKLTEYEIYYNQNNNKLMQEVAQKLGIKSGGVPFLVIGDKHFVGYAEGITSRAIEARVKECGLKECGDIVNTHQTEPVEIVKNEETENITIPILGQTDISKLSLPVLTLVVAALDGFNPCAMWTLLFLISLLLGMKYRKRMWILGLAFITTSALVYFLFMAAWLNLFLYLGYIQWIRGLIGVVALLTGGYYLRDYLVNIKGGCSVMGDTKRQKIFNSLRTIAERPQFILALGGMMLLAIAVNLVELLCSAGLPAIYTQILSLSHLSSWQYYLYLGLYILIFMLDDLLIFFTAMITLKAIGIESKYARYSHLVGGILMLIIGAILLFKPELLMFG